MPSARQELPPEFGPGSDRLEVRIAEMAGRVRGDLLFVIVDVALVVAVYSMVLLLRFNGRIPSRSWLSFMRFLPVVIVAHLATNWICGLYGRIWRYASVEEARRVLLGGSMALTLLVGLTLYSHRLPLSVVAFGAAATTMVVGLSRFQSRLFALHRIEVDPTGVRIAIIGAGHMGAAAVREMVDNLGAGLIPAVVVDDDVRKQGRSLFGIKVTGPIEELSAAAERYKAQQALLAIASADRQLVQRVADAADAAGLPLKVLPPAAERVRGRVLRDIRDLTIDDVIGRQQVETDLRSVSGLLSAKRVLITGAGGSIGSEIARQVAEFQPAELVLLDHDETHLYDAAGSIKFPVRQVLADIRDARAIHEVISSHRPEVIFHAAAHKHVPLLEDYPAEAVRTNVVGTLNIVRAAEASAVERLVFISTDKAVRPVNVMGASKRVGEQLTLSTRPANGKWCAVRFGNVVGSRGSVVPTFMRQIASGGPVTVTDPRMTRYFMSIQEAVQLVLQAAALAAGGEIFVLDMGTPVRIMDLAERMIRLSGRRIGLDIELEVTGVRPGEKIDEELAEPDETAQSTSHPSVACLRAKVVAPDELEARLAGLQALLTEPNDGQIRRTLFELVSVPASLELSDGVVLDLRHSNGNGAAATSNGQYQPAESEVRSSALRS
jgi:FlaA1/EpsC-like NDP-sugar epimerase